MSGDLAESSQISNIILNYGSEGTALSEMLRSLVLKVSSSRFDASLSEISV